MIRIGTRGSKLALWQAYHIQDLLAKEGLESEIITIETKGDKILNTSLSKIGSKGVFTEEIEDQLREGIIDIAVHSAKDVQSKLDDDFELIAFTEREKVNDVVISLNPNFSFEQEGEVVLGTSSTRRVAMVQRFLPKNIKIVSVRGNLQTRLQKMKDGACDALLLAYAGVHRMEMEEYVVQTLPIDQFTPATGQGSVAIEAAINLDSNLKAKIRKATNHPATEKRLLAERAYLRELEGGCSIPVFALATIEGDQLSMTAGIISLDGEKIIRVEKQAPASEAEQLGKGLAEEVLGQGGDQILKDIRAGLAS